MTLDTPPADRHILAEFRTHGDLRAAAIAYRNRLFFGVAVVSVLLAFGWAVVLEPAAELRWFAGLAILASVGLCAGLATRSNRAARTGPTYRCVLSDWGIEFDAPPRGHDRQPPESGGALPWARVARVRAVGFLAAGREGTSTVWLYTPEFPRRPVAKPAPKEGLWGICVPWLTETEATRLREIAEREMARAKATLPP